MGIDSYCLITPAKNEEQYIEKTITAVINQEIKPYKWVIVDDGSTDNTSKIVKEYEKNFNFIHLVSREHSLDRNFSSKVHAFNTGFEILKDEEFEFIGNLDADVSFDEKYYKTVLSHLANDDQLGIAGGYSFDMIGGNKFPVKASLESVRGPVQMFRRDCYIDIGGYTPLRGGGIDSLAEFRARMKGWKTETLSDCYFIHHRRTGSEGNGIISACLKRGRQDYTLGYLPLFEAIRCFSRIFNKPVIVGSLVTLVGYLSAALKRKKRIDDLELINFIRSEQKSKLTAILHGR